MQTRRIIKKAFMCFTLLMTSTLCAEHEHHKKIQEFTNLIEKSVDKSDFKTLLMFLERANSYVKAENYVLAQYDFNHICFAFVPDIDKLEEVFKTLNPENQILFLDAWHGRLHCLAKRGKFSKEFHYEAKLIQKLDTRLPKISESNNDLIVQNFNGDIEELKELMVKTGAVKDAKDIEQLPSGNLKIKMNYDCTSCCDSCEKGKECKGEKKSLN